MLPGKRLFRIVFVLFFILLLLASSISCIKIVLPGEDETELDQSAQPSSPADIDSAQPSSLADIDILVDKASASFTEKGGKLKLKNGANLVVPAGALVGSTNLELKQIDNPEDFGKETIAYDITGLTQEIKTLTLTLPMQKGLQQDEVSVCRYDTASHQVAEIPYTYDSASGTVTVTIDPSKLNASAIGSGFGYQATQILAPPSELRKVLHDQTLLERFRILLTPQRAYVPKFEHLIRTPYYQQSGGACWAADTMMIIKAFETGTVLRNQGQVLHVCEVPNDDYGLGVYGFQTSLARYISRETGATVEWRGFYNAEHMRWRILQELDKDHPLILRLTGLEHYALIVGYRNSGQQIILQDSKAVEPPNQKDGGMYCIRDYSWIQNWMGGFVTASQLLWVDRAVVSSSTLQTINCPGADESGGCSFGTAAFYNINPKNQRQVPLATLKFDTTRLNGHTWQAAGKNVAVVPSDATNFTLKTVAFNAAPNDSRLTVKLQFYAKMTRFNVLSKDVDLPAANENTTIPVQVMQDITMEQIRRPEMADQNANQSTVIDVTLNSGNTVIDGFSLDVVLSVQPKITVLSPTTAELGDRVVVGGVSFGKDRSEKSRVTVGGKNAEIVSWSESEIAIKVPDSAEQGPQPVVVYTGGSYEYKSNEMPLNINIKPPASLSVKALDGTSGIVGNSYRFSALSRNIPSNAMYTWYLNGTFMGSGNAGSTATVTPREAKPYEIGLLVSWINEQGITESKAAAVVMYVSEAPQPTPPPATPPPATPPPAPTPSDGLEKVTLTIPCGKCQGVNAYLLNPDGSFSGKISSTPQYECSTIYLKPGKWNIDICCEKPDRSCDWVKKQIVVIKGGPNNF